MDQELTEEARHIDLLLYTGKGTLVMKTRFIQEAVLFLRTVANTKSTQKCGICLNSERGGKRTITNRQRLEVCIWPGSSKQINGFQRYSRHTGELRSSDQLRQRRCASSRRDGSPYLAGSALDPVKWRWGLEGSARPGMTVARLFRQPRDGDWNAVIQVDSHSLASAQYSPGIERKAYLQD